MSEDARWQVLLDTDSSEGGITIFGFEPGTPGTWWQDISATDAAELAGADPLHRPLVRLVDRRPTPREQQR